MIAVSLKDGEQLVDLLLRKEADVNAKSKLHFHLTLVNYLIIFPRFQWPGKSLSCGSKRY